MKSNAALPPTVRKGFAFPISFIFLFEAAPVFETQPQVFRSPAVRAKPHRTLLRQSREKQDRAAQLLLSFPLS